MQEIYKQREDVANYAYCFVRVGWKWYHCQLPSFFFVDHNIEVDKLYSFFAPSPYYISHTLVYISGLSLGLVQHLFLPGPIIPNADGGR